MLTQMIVPMTSAFRRDRLTWVAYLVLAWFAYLQAAPGLVMVHLRDELDLSYATGGLHVAAFAAGSVVAGVMSARLERALGRRALFWWAAALMGAGAIGFTAARHAEVTGVFTNSGSDGGFATFHGRGEEKSTFATDLQAAGYRTAMMGKYLNGYFPDRAIDGRVAYIPPGWNE